MIGHLMTGHVMMGDVSIMNVSIVMIGKVMAGKIMKTGDTAVAALGPTAIAAAMIGGQGIMMALHGRVIMDTTDGRMGGHSNQMVVPGGSTAGMMAAGRMDGQDRPQLRSTARAITKPHSKQLNDRHRREHKCLQYSVEALSPGSRPLPEWVT